MRPDGVSAATTISRAASMNGRGLVARPPRCSPAMVLTARTCALYIGHRIYCYTPPRLPRRADVLRSGRPDRPMHGRNAPWLADCASIFRLLSLKSMSLLLRSPATLLCDVAEG